MIDVELRRAASNLRRKGGFLRGLLGDYDGNLEVSGRPGYYFVRLEKPGGYEVGVFPGRVRPLYNLPVQIETHPLTNIQFIAGVDDETIAYSGAIPSGVPTLERHGATHDWGGDDMSSWLHTQQLFPLRAQPHATLMQTVVIQPGLYYAEDHVCILQNAIGVDLAAETPLAGHIYITIYLDSSGAAHIENTGATTLFDAPAAPAGMYWVAVVLLRASGGAVGWRDIVDARWFLSAGGSVDLALDDLNDVSITAPNDGDVLTWNQSAGLWQASPLPPAPTPEVFTPGNSVALEAVALDIDLDESPVEV